MPESDDMELVREYARHRSEGAFATLVDRHINLVYSTALRQVRQPDLAKDIAQATFIILSRKAASLGAGTILPVWLLRTVRFVVAAERRTAWRRQRREQEAQMETLIQQEPDNRPDEDQIAPLLDDALAQLGEKDRAAVVLRYFSQKEFTEVGVALGIDAAAAQKRVWRAVEKLRKYLSKRRVTVSAAALGAGLAATGAKAAPAGLVPVVTTAAVTKGTAAVGTAILINATIKLMTWTKIQTGIIAGLVVVLAGGAGTLLLHSQIVKPPLVFPEDQESIQQWRQMSLTALTNTTEVSRQVASVSINMVTLASPEAREKVRDRLGAFLAYASANNFEAYTNFWGLTPEVKYRLPGSASKQLQQIYTNVPFDAAGQIPLARYFELRSFGTMGHESNYWHFESAGLDRAFIYIYSTNQAEGSLARAFADQEFKSGGSSSTNNKFIWPRGKSDIVDREGKVTMAVAKVYLKLADSGINATQPACFPLSRTILFQCFFRSIGTAPVTAGSRTN